MKKVKYIYPLSKINLKSRLWLAFSFATFFPAMILLYYLTNLYSISFFILLIILFIILLGWWFVFEAFSSIMKIHSKSQDIIKRVKEKEGLGDLYIKNEVERLDGIFNMLSSKVRENVEELKEVSHKTEELNRAIAHKVNILSTIFQANILFSRGASAEDIFQFLTERLKAVIEANASISFLKKEGQETYNFFFSGPDQGKVSEILESKDFINFFMLQERRVLDKKHKLEQFSFIQKILGLKNLIINPIYLREQVIGFIIAGNTIDNFVFSSDNSDIMDLFSHYMSIVWEHERLSKRVEDLEILDPLTGIYNEKFFFARLDEEINRAVTYQRPCGVLVMEIANYSEYQQSLGLIELERFLKRVAKVCKDNVRSIDILGRIQENRIGIILIEKNKRQSYHVGAKLKEAVYTFLKDEDQLKPQISFAVAENPVDGANASQLFECIQSQFKSQ